MPDKFRVCFPPDPNPKPPRFPVPAGAWDSHFHIFGPPHAFPYADSRLYTPPAAPVEHYFAMAKAIGLERGVFVAPAVHAFDPAVMHDAIVKSDGRLKGMIRANVDLGDAELRKLHEQGVRGVRFNFVEALEGAFSLDFMHTVCARVAKLPWPWVVDFHIESHLLARHAEVLRKLKSPVVIDHFGLVEGTRGVKDPDFKVLLDLMGETHMHVKITGTDRQLYHGVRFEDVVPLARALVAKAPDRCIWGTDWPHAYVYGANRMINDGDLISMLVDFVPDGAVRKKVLVDNPARLFGF